MDVEHRDEDDGGGRAGGRWTGIALVVGLLAWLWPIGVGGRMPVGGDVTQFSIGLMAEFGRSIREGRIPFWNDLWGYGFPGLAESQMGAYYPPNLLLYGLLPVEAAYTASLVLHTLWAGLGACWASGRFGASRRGSAVAGFAWGTCGFFLVHLPHHWGATTASWMPWAWGLAWSVATGTGSRRSAPMLAAVLAIQVLPGHFQLAFITEVTTLLVGLCGLTTKGDRIRRAIRFGSALAAVLPLAAAQLGPTAELAGLAGSRRDFGYLSAFASTPVHMVSYVAPGLFHESPLWRPLAWDAFRAMPEEHLATIGLAPLFLACAALWVGRRDPSTRSLAIVATAATFLSLGPYAPGFATLCRMPGFSFFRAPARWGAAAMLALAILAGRGLDAWPTLARPGRALRWFALIAAAWPALIVGVFEVALAANEPAGGRPAWPSVAGAFDRAFRLMPWSDGPSLGQWLSDARKPLDDGRVPVALARRGQSADDPRDRTLTRRRGAIYAQELGPTYALIALLVAASTLAGRSRRGFEVALLLVLLAEAGYWSRRRPIDLAPIRPLTERSPVLDRLARLPRGTRSVDPARNLAMVAGAAPIAAYRTLDLPILPRLTVLAAATAGVPEVARALRATGAGVRVVPGVEPRPPTGWERRDEVADPALLGWLTGEDWVRSLGDRAPSKYAIERPSAEPARAWFVSGPVADLARAGDDPRTVLAALASARAIAWRSPRPEEVTLAFETTGPGSIVLTRLDYPRWRAVLDGPSGAEAVPIARVFGGWQGVAVPRAGSWTLRLRFDATRDYACLAASGLAWLGWGLVYWRASRRPRAEAEESAG